MGKVRLTLKNTTNTLSMDLLIILMISFVILYLTYRIIKSVLVLIYRISFKQYSSYKRSILFKKIIKRINDINKIYFKKLDQNKVSTEKDGGVYYRLNQIDKSYIELYIQFIIDTEVLIEEELRNRLNKNKYEEKKGYYFSEIFKHDKFEKYKNYENKITYIVEQFNVRYFKETGIVFKDILTDNIMNPKKRYYSLIELSEKEKLSSPDKVIDIFRDNLLSLLDTDMDIEEHVEYSKNDKELFIGDDKFKIDEDHFIQLNGKVSQGDVIGVGFNEKNKLIEHLFKPVLGTLNDIETSKYNLYLLIGDNIIKQTQLGRKLSVIPNKFQTYLRFDKMGLNIGFDEYSYIIYLFQINNNVLNKGDLIIFRTDTDKISIEVNTQSINKRGHYYYNVNHNGETHILTPPNIETVFYPIRITSNDLNKIKELGSFQVFHYEKKTDNYYQISPHDDYDLYNECNVYDILQYMVNKLPDVEQFKSLEEISDESVYVYLMYDESSNLYKIGISNNPQYREKTLQGQIPKVNTIISREFRDRKLSLIMEKTLHEYFKPKHVRGEWFDLNKYDLEQFYSLLGVKP